MNNNVAGIHVPDEMLEELKADKEKTKAGITGVEIAARIIKACKPYCPGVHIYGFDRLTKYLCARKVVIDLIIRVELDPAYYCTFIWDAGVQMIFGGYSHNRDHPKGVRSFLCNSGEC